MGYYVPPGISDATVPNPIFNLTPAATVDEGNNWININWGPLSLSNPSVVRAAGTNAPALGNYGPAAGSPVINYVPSTATSYAAAPGFDFYGTARKANNAVDAGAVEFAGGGGGGGTAVLNVTGGPLAFGNAPTGTNSAAQTLTLNNTGTAAATGITVVVTTTSTPTTPNQFARLGGTCGATLASSSTCTITVRFSPTSTGAKTGTATITANVSVTGSPVSLSGTGVAAVVSASLAPASWTAPNTTRGCTTGGGSPTCPLQIFVLTNTGNVTLTGIGHGALGGTNASEFIIATAMSTCGAATTTPPQPTGNTSLAPGASCNIAVRFAPLTAQPIGVKTATVSVADAAGTQTSTLAGTAQ
jgi:hypothetical protein